MTERIVYMDSSAILKRYVKEPGSDIVRRMYIMALSGEVKLSFNVWNVGEILGILDKARNTGRLGEREYLLTRKRFLSETRRLLRLGQLLLVPLRMRVLQGSWRIVEEHHVYQADAIQIESAKLVKSTDFLVADKRLHGVAVKEGINSTLLT